MEYEIVYLNEKIVAGLIKETTNVNNKAVNDIGELWKMFLQSGVYEQIGNKMNDKTIGLYTDYQGDYTKPYNFLACCEVSKIGNVNIPIVIKKINGGKYAKFIIKGDVQKAVGEFWCELWKMNLDRKYSCDFEEYQNSTDDMDNMEIHIYIALN